MPTAGGLPKPGEIWIRTYRLPEPGAAGPSARAWKTHTVVFKVISRSPGSYWALRVDVLEAEGTLMSKQDYNVKNVLWVDPAYWLQQGELEFIKKDDGRPWAQQRKTIGFEDLPDRLKARDVLEPALTLASKLTQALQYAPVLYCDDGPHAGMIRLDLLIGPRDDTNIRRRPIYLTKEEVAVFKGHVL